MHQQRFVTQNLVSSVVPGSPGTAGTAAAPGQPRGFSRTSGCGDPAKEVRAALLPAWQGRASALPLTRRFLEGDRLLTQLSPPRRVPGLLAGSVLPPAPATAVARWSPSSPEAGSAQPEGLKRGARRLPLPPRRSPVLPRAAAPANARLSRPEQLAGRATSSDPPAPNPGSVLPPHLYSSSRPTSMVPSDSVSEELSSHKRFIPAGGTGGLGAAAPRAVPAVLSLRGLRRGAGPCPRLARLLPCPHSAFHTPGFSLALLPARPQSPRLMG